MTKSTLFSSNPFKIAMWFSSRFQRRAVFNSYLDAGGHGSTLLTDLFKVFDCIDHQLLNAKLNACGVDINSLYFQASKQRTKVSGSYSNFDHILVAFRKVLYQVHYYLTYTPVIYFLELEIQIQPAMLIITRHTLSLQKLMWH